MGSCPEQKILEAEHRFSTPITQPVLVEVPYSILSAYVHEEVQITPVLALTLGLRRDEYSTKGSATTPRGALVYHPSGSSTLKLLAGEAFRAPNIFELHVSLPAAGVPMEFGAEKPCPVVPRIAARLRHDAR